MNKKIASIILTMAVVIGGGISLTMWAHQVSAATQPAVLDQSYLLTKSELAQFQAVASGLKAINASTTIASKKPKFVVVGDYCFIKKGGVWEPVGCPV
jgi:hypothetical protein